MNPVLSSASTRLHLLLVGAVAAAGITFLALGLGTMAFSADPYSRDMGLLGLIITAPLWLLGIGAAVDALSVLRSRPVTRARGLAWALVVGIGGMLLAVSSGALEIVVLMITDPGRVYLDLPVVAVNTIDGGTNYYYLDSPLFWLPVAGIILGGMSLIAQATDRRASESRKRQVDGA
jgi:hypothetical protein